LRRPFLGFLATRKLGADRPRRACRPFWSPDYRARAKNAIHHPRHHRNEAMLVAGGWLVARACCCARWYFHSRTVISFAAVRIHRWFSGRRSTADVLARLIVPRLAKTLASICRRNSPPRQHASRQRRWPAPSDGSTLVHGDNRQRYCPRPRAKIRSERRTGADCSHRHAPRTSSSCTHRERDARES